MTGWEIRLILVGYDGSEGAERAIEVAQEVARARGAEVVVLTAFPRASRTVESEEKVSQDIGRARRMAESAIERLRAAGIDARTDVAEGPAGQALINAAEARGADLIVVGNRGLNPIASLLLGSTTEEVVRRATVPVLVAR